MEPSKPGDDRWKELADLLGLSSDQDAAAPPETKPVAAVRHVEPEPARHEAPAVDDSYEAIEEDEMIVDDPELSLAAADEEMGEEDEEEIGEGAELSEGPPEAPPLPGDEDKPKRGRRRRRRGRRRNGDKPEGEVAGQPAAPRAPEPRDARPGQPRPRDDRNARPAQPAVARERDANPHERGDSRSRRGRRDEPQEPRRPETPELEEVNEELEEVEMSNPPAALARNLEDDTDFSDWNVPSWQELISSLYRPDR